MAKIRIHELAKKVGLSTKEAVEHLRRQGVEVKSNLSAVDESVESLLLNVFKGSSPEGAIGGMKPADMKPAAEVPKRPQPPSPGSASPLSSSQVKPAARTAGEQVPSVAKPAPATKTPTPSTSTRTAQGATPARPHGGGPSLRTGAPVTSPSRTQGHRPDGPSGPVGSSSTATPASTARAPGQPAQTQPAAQRPARASVAEPHPAPLPTPPPGPPKPIAITEGVTVRELAEKMELKANDVLKRLLMRGVMTNVNRPIDPDTAQKVALEFGFEARIVSFEESAVLEEREERGTGERHPRPPVVTVMGHVDHGKTSLLDAIRETRVVDKEHGGITQHIGAYGVTFKNRGITFLDTPGHEAFTLMRARGAKVTDIVVLVVAADDGVMPQTKEAIDHARAAGVPIIVAINKIDKPDAKPDVVRKQLSDYGLLVEEWGGEIVSVQLSAKQRTGIADLLEMILLVADIQDLKADPALSASGTVLEARLDRSRGPVATVLVQNGTLSIGDAFIAGAISGKVRAMYDEAGEKVFKAPPSSPVEVLGMQGVPMAGDSLKVLGEEWKARQIGVFRQQKLREEALSKSSRMTLDHLFQKIQEGVVKELTLVVKTDVQGSVEALTKILADIASPKVKVRVIHASTGAITESDVLLAAATNSIIIGFNVRPEPKAADLAQKEQVDLRLHTVVYNVANEIKAAMAGMLEPTYQEVKLGRAEVRDTFKVPKYGTIAGCMVTEGKVLRNSEVRLLRDNVVIHTGRAASLRRFKEDVGEVKSGYECGIGLEKFNDLKPGDVIEAFKVEKIISKELYA